MANMWQKGIYAYYLSLACRQNHLLGANELTPYPTLLSHAQFGGAVRPYKHQL